MSRSEVFVLDTPCRRITSRKNRLAKWEALEVFLQGMKYAIFVNLSTTTKTKSISHWVQEGPPQNPLKCLPKVQKE